MGGVAEVRADSGVTYPRRENLQGGGRGRGAEAEPRDACRKLHPLSHARWRNHAPARVRKHPRNSLQPSGGAPAALLTRLPGRRQLGARRLRPRLGAGEVLGLGLLAPRHGEAPRARRSPPVAYFRHPSLQVRKLRPPRPERACPGASAPRSCAVYPESRRPPGPQPRPRGPAGSGPRPPGPHRAGAR